MKKTASKKSSSAGPVNPGSEAPMGVAYLVARLDRVLRRRLGETVAHLGVTVPQYTALAVLSRRGQLSNAQLAERSFVTPQAANEMVKTMEMRGWIERQNDPNHGRIIHLRLTPAGEQLVARCNAATAQLEASMLGQLNETERGQLLTHLRACVQGLGAMIIDSGN